MVHSVARIDHVLLGPNGQRVPPRLAPVNGAAVDAVVGGASVLDPALGS